jgi:hypothetical protein
MEGAEKSEAEGKSETRKKEAANALGGEPLRAFRAQLVSLEQKAQEFYDKAVLTLSGGALGLSLIVVKDYLRLGAGGAGGLIVLALLCWTLSVSCILFSYLSSRKALRNAIRRADRGAQSAQLEEQSNRALGLSTGSGVLFLVGVGFFVAYVAIEPGGKQQPVSTAPEEIARFLSLYDSIREACPDCSTIETRKILQVCEDSYIVPEVLREACPRCSEKGILQLGRRCMEKWNSPR